MHITKTILACTALGLAVSACAPVNTQNQYEGDAVGQEINVQFGTIIAKREVKIQEKNTGTGSTVGGLGGAAAGSAFGQGGGKVVGVLAGMAIGAIAGHIAENEMQNRKGIEYTIHKTNGHTVAIVQNIAKDDTPLAVGQKVMVQTSGSTEIKDGDTTTRQAGIGYVRVLPVDEFPADATPKKKSKK